MPIQKSNEAEDRHNTHNETRTRPESEALPEDSANEGIGGRWSDNRWLRQNPNHAPLVRIPLHDGSLGISDSLRDETRELPPPRGLPFLLLFLVRRRRHRRERRRRPTTQRRGKTTTTTTADYSQEDPRGGISRCRGSAVPRGLHASRQSAQAVPKFRETRPVRGREGWRDRR